MRAQPWTVVEVNRSQRLLLVCAVLGVLAAATGALLGGVNAPLSDTPSSQAQATSAADWQERLRGCAQGVMTFAVLSSDQVQACLEAQMREAFSAGGLGLVEAALEAEIENSPDLYYACHNLAHRVGAHAYTITRDAGELLGQATEGSCAYGLGHGVLDGFAEAHPSAAEYARVAQACVDVRRQPGNERVICPDGLGHAAWKIAGEMAAAVNLCALVPTGEGRRECGEGIVMQVYEPAGSRPDLSAPLAPESLITLCQSWPTKDPELLAGCASGAGYIFTRPAWKLEVAWLNSHGQDPLDASTAGEMVDLLGQASLACGRLEPAFRSGCLQSMAIQLPLTVQRDRVLAEKVCRLLGDWETMCLATNTQVM